MAPLTMLIRNHLLSDLERLAFWSCFGSTQKSRVVFGLVGLAFLCVAGGVAWWGAALLAESWALILAFPLCLAVGARGASAAGGAIRLSSKRRMPNTFAAAWLCGWRRGQCAFGAVAVVLAGLLSQGLLDAFSVACLFAAAGQVAGTWSSLWQRGLASAWFALPAGPLWLSLIAWARWKDVPEMSTGDAWSIVVCSVVLVGVSMGLANRRLTAVRFGALKGEREGEGRLSGRPARPNWIENGSDRLRRLSQRWRTFGLAHELPWYRTVLSKLFIPMIGTSFFISFGSVVGHRSGEEVTMGELWSTQLALLLWMTAMFRQSLVVQTVHWRRWLMPGLRSRARFGRDVFWSSVRVHAVAWALWLVGWVCLFKYFAGARIGWGDVLSHCLRYAFYLLIALAALAAAVYWASTAGAAQRPGRRLPSWVGDVTATFCLAMSALALGFAPFVTGFDRWPLYAPGGPWLAVGMLLASAALVHRADVRWSGGEAMLCTLGATGRGPGLVQLGQQAKVGADGA